MGDRGHLPLALSARRAGRAGRAGRSLAAAALALAAAGCVDFADPPMPNAGAPAVAQIALSVLDNGTVIVNATIQPGRDSSGVTRIPLDSTLFVSGRAIEADTVLARNTLQFSEVLAFGPADMVAPITVVAPKISGIRAPEPNVSWYGMLKLDTGTIRLPRGQDLSLHVATRRGVGVPAVQQRQWFLDLSGSGGVFRVSGNGFPPDTLRIPPQWLPLPETGPATIVASMIYYQSAQLRPDPGDYIGIVSIDSRATWLIQVQ